MPLDYAARCRPRYPADGYRYHATTMPLAKGR